mgnify:CR=1 FL=1
MKQPARSFPIPTPVQNAPVEEAAYGVEQDPFIQATPEQNEMVDSLTDEIFLYMYRDGHEEIVEDLKNSKDNLPEAVGTMAGNLVTTEIQLLEEEGGSFSEDMFVEASKLTVEQFTDLVEDEGIKEFRNNGETQAFMGEALTHAMGAAIDSDYPAVNEKSMMSVAQNLLEGDMDMQASPVSGTRVIEEVV